MGIGEERKKKNVRIVTMNNNENWRGCVANMPRNGAVAANSWADLVCYYFKGFTCRQWVCFYVIEYSRASNIFPLFSFSLAFSFIGRVSFTFIDLCDLELFNSLYAYWRLEVQFEACATFHFSMQTRAVSQCYSVTHFIQLKRRKAWGDEMQSRFSVLFFKPFLWP